MYRQGQPYCWLGERAWTVLWNGHHRKRRNAPPGPLTNQVLIEDMRERGVLISRVGPHDNVLTMRPPLVFTKENADILLGQLELSLANLS